MNLRRRVNGLPPETPTIDDLFTECGWDDSDTEGSLRRLAAAIDGVDGLRFMNVRTEAKRRLTRSKAARPEDHVEAAFRGVRLCGPEKSPSNEQARPEGYGFRHTSGQAAVTSNHMSAVAGGSTGKRRFTFWITPNQNQALKAIKGREGISQAEQLRRAIDSWIRSRRRAIE